MSDATGSDVEDLPEDEIKEGQENQEDDLPEGEEVVEEEQEEEEVEEEELPLNSRDFISRPYLSENCSLPEDFLVFDYSFGYDCKQYFNLVLLEENVLAFYSGNILHFFNTKTKDLWFRRSALGGGIGHISNNPNPEYNHLAVAEKGDKPFIVIYEWPTFEIISLLKGGTEKTYSFINYSPDGEMLCSQGGDPDYQITVWNWKESKIILRSQAYINDVFICRFSPTIPGSITTSGIGHIKFWKMARTTTGLKLMGSLGRFGKTEMCDIIGFYSLQDGKVLSGCEWGNMLLWEEGLIQVEARRKQKQPCHTAPITHFEFEYSGDLITAGMDGYIRLWFFDTIDGADPPEEDPYVELEPTFELKIGNEKNTASIMCMLKIYENPQNQEYYCQDGNGGVWRYDIYSENENEERKPAEQLYICHSGPVMDVAASPMDDHIATLGKDGRLFVYNYLERKLLIVKKFESPGRCLIWFPLSVEKSGSVLVAAFEDGIIRVLVVYLQESLMTDSTATESVVLIQVLKAHDKPITTMSLNERGSLLVTGSEESRVFVFQVKKDVPYSHLEPIGFVPVPNAVTYLCWKPGVNSTLMVCCKSGEFVEMTLPELPQNYTNVSYHLVQVETSVKIFHSCKSQIERNIKIREIEERKAKKLEAKRAEMEKIKADNPGIDIDEETFLADSESEEELGPVYIPEIPNPIFFCMYTPRNTIWISMGGYDAGFVYEYAMEKDEPIKCIPVPEAYNIEIQSYIFNHNKRYLILAMEDGRIRVTRFNPNEFTDLTDYWLYSMHDNTNGRIRRMCFNHNQRYMFTCGDDGNIFSYHVNFEDDNDYLRVWKKAVPPTIISPKERVKDIVDPAYLSLEGAKMKAEYDRKMALANRHKEKVLLQLEKLKERFVDLLKRNEKLPDSQKIPVEQFEIHPNITEDLNKKLQGDIDLVKRKLAFQLEKSTLALTKVQDYFLNVLETLSFYVIGIRNNAKVSAFRLRKLPPDFEEAEKEVLIKIEELLRKGRGPELHVVREEAPPEPERKIPLFELFLKSIPLDSSEFKANKKLLRLIDKYLQRKSKEEYRQKKWQKLWSRKPDKSKLCPEDVDAIKIAQETIGDFKLKSAPDYRVPKHLRMSTVIKYDELLKARKRMHMEKHEFNQEIYDLRNKKVALIERYEELKKVLRAIHKELDVPKRKHAAPTPKFIDAQEFPEKGIRITEDDMKRAKRRKSETAEDTLESMFLQMDSKIEVKKVIGFEEDPTDIVPPDKEYEPLLGSFYEVSEDQEMVKMFKMPYFKSGGQKISFDDLQDLTKSDNNDTRMETELKALRLKRQLHKQDNILKEIETKTEEFDKEVQRLKLAKVTAQLNSQLLELHTLTLQQEVLILNDYEAIENEVSDKVMVSLEEKHNMQQKIIEVQKHIDYKNRTIAGLMDKQNDIAGQFQQAITENKFADFLKRIFKKKYKPPKIRDPDASSSSSESSSSSSSSEDEDAASIESGDMGFIRYDESTCPEGCDRTIYDLTFTLRSQRHTIEQQVIEEKKIIESLKKDLDGNMKKIKVATAIYDTNLEELEVLQREKQQRLNEVNCLVLLKLSQIQSFQEDSTKLEVLSKSLVFSSEALKKLYARVGELDKETQIQLDDHLLNRKHLHKLKLDCEHMVSKIHQLKEVINECMYRKFNGRINIDELEESIIRRIVAEMKSSPTEMRKHYEKIIHETKEKLDEKKENLCRYIQENTEKLHLLIALEEEKNLLDKLLRIQKYKLEEAVEEKGDPYKADIKKLTDIMNRQAAQIEALKNEIRALSLKTRPLPPIARVSRTTIPEEPAEATCEEFPVEEEEELDPTGIRASLNEMIASLSPELGYGSGEVSVKNILTDILDQLLSREPSFNDTAAVQEILTSIVEKIGRKDSSEVIATIHDIVHDVIANVTGAASIESIEFIQNIAGAIIEEVTGESDERSLSPVHDIAERIATRQPLPDDPEGTQEVLKEVAEHIKSSEHLLDPVSASEHIIQKLLSTIETKDQDTAEQEYKSTVIACIDNITAEIESGNQTESTEEILTNVIKVAKTQLMTFEEITDMQEIINVVLKEITESGKSDEDIKHAKKIVLEAFKSATRSIRRTE